MARRLGRWSLPALIWLLFFYGIWGLFLDREPPVTFVSNTERSFHPETGVLQMDRVAIKARHCDGVRHTILSDGLVITLPDVRLPPDGFRTGHKTISGEKVNWTVAIQLPNDTIRDDFIDTETIYFHCNPMQYIYPIRVPLPVAHIPYEVKNESPARLPDQ